MIYLSFEQYLSRDIKVPGDVFKGMVEGPLDGKLWDADGDEADQLYNLRPGNRSLGTNSNELVDVVEEAALDETNCNLHRRAITRRDPTENDGEPFLSYKFHDSRCLMYGRVVQEDNAVASEVGI